MRRRATPKNPRLPAALAVVAALALAALLAVGAVAQDPSAAPGPEGHAAHDHHQTAGAQQGHAGHETGATDPADHATHAAQAPMPHGAHPMGSELRIVRVLEPPVGFKGNVAFDPESRRLWLLSFGPPANTKGPSRLFELDPEDGRVLRSAQMPFLGEFGAPVFIDGYLYQLIAHESKVYRVSVAPDRFGQVDGEIRLPGLNDVEHAGDEPLRFPFISFRGLARTPDGNLLAHAQDLGEFFVLDRETGEVLQRVATLRALGGITAAPKADGPLLVVANSDPVRSAFDYQVRRMMFRAEHGIVPSVRYGKEAIHWVLLDARSGEILASLRRLDPETDAGSIALVDHEPVDGAPFGRFTFLATGDDGLFTLEWTPGKRS